MRQSEQAHQPVGSLGGIDRGEATVALQPISTELKGGRTKLSYRYGNELETRSRVVGRTEQASEVFERILLVVTSMGHYEKEGISVNHTLSKGTL